MSFSGRDSVITRCRYPMEVRDRCVIFKDGVMVALLGDGNDHYATGWGDWMV
jgi:hypothetical protein